MVRYAAAMYNRFAIGSDGKTPIWRSTGRPWSAPTAPFGKRVWWKPLHAKKVPSASMRGEEGFYLGPAEGSNESEFLTFSGVVRARTFIRRPPSEQWSADLLKPRASTLCPNLADPQSDKIGIRAPVFLTRPIQGRRVARGP